MGQWSDAERAVAIKGVYKNDDGYATAKRLFRQHFNTNRNNPVPSLHATKTWVKDFEETCLALKNPSVERK
jgi:hypothetical protein